MLATRALGATTWVVADGYIPPESTGPAPAMTSHDSVCILNAGPADAVVELVVYFTDRPPAGPYILHVASQRAHHQRINDLRQPERISTGVDYSMVLSSTEPIVVQHTRLDSRQAANALMSTIAYAQVQAMSEVRLEGIEKVYDNGFRAVHDLDLQVLDGEFLVLVGPSGCGKSTALRMVAGLESITSGTLKIGDRIVNDVAPKDRDIAFVFQNYALYPHMSVRENIGFSLKLRKAPQAEKNTRVDAVARLLELQDHLDRRPAQLSGGQRQRVAMGRAIVRRPQVFLMDEPLSNLDAKLRVQMRAEISRLQHDIGVTTLYVTHDQIEAMTMGSRVAVLSNGRLMQVDTPQRLYDRPDNVFVATFIGSPQMNLVAGTVRLGEDPYLEIGQQQLALTPPVLAAHPALESRDGGVVAVGIRPEDLEDASLVDGGGLPRRALDVVVELREGLGSEVVAYARLDARAPEVEAAQRDPEATLTGGRGVEMVARLDPRTEVAIDTPARLAVNVERLHFFDVGSTEAIRD